MSKDWPWLDEYKVFGIPKTFKPYPKSAVFEILYRTARKFKNMGLVQLGYEMSYPEVRDHVDRLATALHAMGIKKGDRIATLLPTSIQFIIVDYGISRAGAVHIPSSSLEPSETLVYKFNEGRPRVLVCTDKDMDLAMEVRKKANIEHLIVTRLNDYSASPATRHDTIEGVLWLTDLIAKHGPEPPDIDFDVETDLETLLFTGGTTGLPKGCMLTHRNIYANTIQNSYALGIAAMVTRGAVSALLGIPFFHSYGHSVMHTMTNLGLKQLLVIDPRDTKGMVEMIKTYRPMLQMGVPTQFMKLMDEELKGIGIIGISGSAPLSPKIQEEFEKKGGGGIMEGYGLSEMSPVTHLNTSMMLRLVGSRSILKINNMFLKIPGVVPVLNRLLRLLGSKYIGWIIQKILPKLMRFSGKKRSKSGQEKRSAIGLPFPDTEIKIIDVDTGRPLSWDEVIKQGKTGEMCLKGPQRMLGYWPEAESGLDEEGYVHTGDVVKVDEQGYFYVVDRTKDMIVVSGFKVYSREVDDLLYKHPAVQMAATVGVPDPERPGSERVVVYIQLKDKFKGRISEEEIVEYLKSKVAKYAVPKKVIFIDEMPLTEVQKVNKKLIRKMAEGELDNINKDALQSDKHVNNA